MKTPNKWAVINQNFYCKVHRGLVSPHFYAILQIKSYRDFGLISSENATSKKHIFYKEKVQVSEEILVIISHYFLNVLLLFLLRFVPCYANKTSERKFSALS